MLVAGVSKAWGIVLAYVESQRSEKGPQEEQRRAEDAYEKLHNGELL